MKIERIFAVKGFVSSKFVASPFIRIIADVLVYVDDIVITGNDEVHINIFVDSLNKQFSLKDLGKFGYFLGIEVSYLATGGISLGQKKYILDPLKHIHMDQAKMFLTPVVSNCILSAQVGVPIENESKYRSIVITRLEIASVVNRVCQFMQKAFRCSFQSCQAHLKESPGNSGSWFVFG